MSIQKTPSKTIRVSGTGGITVSLKSGAPAAEVETEAVCSTTSSGKPLPWALKQDAQADSETNTGGAIQQESSAAAAAGDDEDDDLSSLEDTAGEGQDADAEVEIDEDTLDAAEVDNGVLEIYNEKCLRCTHLVPHADKKFNNCHFSKGNDRCPASSVQILIGIPLDNIVNAFLTAEQIGDNSRLGRLYAQLAEKPAWQQQRIQEAITLRRAERKAK